MSKRPTLIYDGECGFCRRWIARWKNRTQDRIDYLAFQDMGAQFPGVSREACKSAVQLVELDGSILGGADAVVRLFDFGLPGGSAMKRILAAPPIIWFLRIGYQLIARHRQLISKLRLG